MARRLVGRFLLAVGLLGGAAAAGGSPPGAPADSQAAVGEAGGAGAESAAAAERAKAQRRRFVRLRRDEQGRPVALQTAILHYRSPAGQVPQVRVDLIGAIHVADAAYYAELNRRFAGYEVVLYELVAPEGARPPRDGPRPGGGHPVSSLQMGMKSLLGLQFQLEGVDYSRPNLVHADMTPEEFARSMRQRGESFTQMFFRMLGHALAQQSNDPAGVQDMAMLAALFAPDRELRLKRLLAEQFDDLEGQLTVFGGPEGSTLITERNKKALAVLRRQLEAGRRRLAVFYGAGHLPDMERRLFADFGLERRGCEWLTAWDLQGR